jgi:hypothetical protein
MIYSSIVKKTELLTLTPSLFLVSSFGSRGTDLSLNNQLLFSIPHLQRKTANVRFQRLSPITARLFQLE